MLRGGAVLAAVWWAWAGYAWLTNPVGIDQDIAFRLRNMRSLNRQRLVVAALFLLLIPVSYQLSSLVVLAMATCVLVALVAYEAIRFREARHQLRAHGPAE